MADPTTNSEAAAVEAQEQKFNKEDALNTKGFVSFLAKFSDAEGGEVSDRQIEERFEVFETKNKVTEDVKRIYTEEFSAEMDIKLSRKDLEKVDECIENIAINDPKEILRMAKSIEKYNEYPTKISEAQAVLNEYEKRVTARQENISADKIIAEQAKGGVGLKGKIGMYAGLLANKLNGDWGKDAVAVSSAQEKLKMIGIPVTLEGIGKRFFDLNKELYDLSKEAERITAGETKKITGMIRGFGNLKNTMFANLSIHDEIVKLAKEKLKKQISDLAAGGKPKGTDKALDRVEGVEDNKVLGSAVMTEDEKKAIEKELDDRADEHVKDSIANILGSIKFKSKPFAEIERSLSEFTELETIGTKNSKETRQYIIDSMQLYMANNLSEDKPENREKKILINQLISKLQKPITK